MRHSRPLTPGENWDLAMLLVLIVGILLAITLAWRLSRIPHLWAVSPPRVMVAMSESPNQQNSVQRQAAPLPTTPAMSNTFTVAKAHAPLADRLVRDVPVVHARVIRHTDSYWYHGRRYVFWKTLRLRVTSYAADRQCCWPYPGTTTASGQSVWTNHGHLVAADTRLIPFHFMVRVPGYDGDHPVPVLDRGGAIHGYRLDVLAPTLWSAQHWGVKFLTVKIYRPVANW